MIGPPVTTFGSSDERYRQSSDDAGGVHVSTGGTRNASETIDETMASPMLL